MNPSTPSTAARFVTGSTMRHVIVMAGTGAIGLMAVFAVDLANLFYVSMLGDTSVAAAIGFAGTINFFHVAISIGMSIGVSATVARLARRRAARDGRGRSPRRASSSWCS